MSEIKIPQEEIPKSESEAAKNEFTELFGNNSSSDKDYNDIISAYILYQNSKLEEKKFNQIIYLREKFSTKIYEFTVGWSIAIFILLITQCFVNEYFVKLDNKVIITLITTTTANAFGFMLIVLKFVFNNNELSYSKPSKGAKKNKNTGKNNLI